MARRFIVATNSAVTTKEHRDAITRHLEEQGWSVWHWFEDLWLVNASDQIKLPELREKLTKVTFDNLHVLVLSTEGPIDHAGKVNPGGIPWLKEKWSRKSSGGAPS